MGKDRSFRPRVTQEELDLILQHREGGSIEITTETSENSYKKEEFSMPSAWDISNNRFMTIEEYCDTFGLNKENVASSKLVSHNAGHMVYNIHFRTQTEDIESVDFDKVISDAIDRHSNKIQVVQEIEPWIRGASFDRAIYTDCHIGMDTNKDGIAMYATRWDKREQLRRAEVMADTIIENKKSSVLYLDELGDFMDGWNGYTTRGGHKLPQNMSNTEAYDAGVDFNMLLIDILAPHYKRIIVNKITNDNHSGDFGYIVSKTAKRLIALKYKNVEMNLYRGFINDYIVGDHCFVITHGKDEKHQKFGFKPILDAKQEKKIVNYLNSRGILKKSKYVEFSKGDSHQALFDYTTAEDFSYCNYPAFSPSSEWVQTNFQKGKSGFTMQTWGYYENKVDTKIHWF